MPRFKAQQVKQDCWLCGGVHFGSGMHCPIMGKETCRDCHCAIEERAPRFYGNPLSDLYGLIFCPDCARRHSFDVYECERTRAA